MGSILYNGPFDPQIPSPTEPPSQNITVDIPSDIPQGEAQLNFAHFFMIGVSGFLLKSNFNLIVISGESFS